MAKKRDGNIQGKADLEKKVAGEKLSLVLMCFMC